MALKIVKGAGHAETEIEYKSGAKKATNETVGQITTMAEPALVTVSLAYTKNLGNYESAKAMVTLAMPCDAEPLVIEQTFKEVKVWVDAKLSELLTEISDSAGEAKS